MDRTQLIHYCLSKPGAVQEFPFGTDVGVFKVMNKMFALIPVDGPVTISLKCDPTLAQMLRDTYPAVTGAYHLNKTHWNGVAVDGSVSDGDIEEWIDHSYDLIVKSLPRKQQAQLAGMAGEGQ